MTALAALSEQWRQTASTLAQYGDARGAALLRQAAAELDAAVQSAQDETLTLEEAVRESGYSDRRIRELLADGTIPNAGRKGAPRVRRADLPRKAPRTSAGGYDAEADARSLLRLGGT